MASEHIQERIVLSIDPGYSKCGVAVVSATSGVLWAGVVVTNDIDKCVHELLERFPINAILLGRGTGSRAIQELLNGVKGVPTILVDERFTTLDARRRYFQDHPPRGWRRLIPLSLQVPPEPYDHYAAILLAERYLKMDSCE
ncbi:MAG TPA: hypothetical protein EYP10_14900 [Armatimonadetes bacterium]|nr:hypothetical protein [Armatimonadota bacterium]